MVTDRFPLKYLKLNYIKTAKTKYLIYFLFQSFLGQRYGYRPIPPVIPTAEFTVLVAELEKEDEEGERGLLQEWYICDENSVPPVYQLQVKYTHDHLLSLCNSQ